MVQGETDEYDDNEGPRLVEKVSTRNRGRPKRNVPSEPSETSNTVKKKRVVEKDSRDPDAIDGKIPIASRKPPKNSMPITVYRMSTNDSLDYENDRSSDSLINPSAFPKNNGVNAVDVLAQNCHELIAPGTLADSKISSSSQVFRSTTLFSRHGKTSKKDHPF